MKELKKIKYWLFDLDNTLYSGDKKNSKKLLS
jgi:FMN phosphatase YigB (HAD superfamily)